MSSNTNKLLAGALLAGMGIVTDQATLIAAASRPPVLLARNMMLVIASAA